MEHTNEVEQLRAENARLREALQSIIDDYEFSINRDIYGARAFSYVETARAALASDARTEGGA